jgi:hypothetical protein
MGTIVSSKQEKIQIILKITLLAILVGFSKRYFSIAIKHVHDLKLSYENPKYLAHSSRYKTFAHQVV